MRPSTHPLAGYKTVAQISGEALPKWHNANRNDVSSDVRLDLQSCGRKNLRGEACIMRVVRRKWLTRSKRIRPLARVALLGAVGTVLLGGLARANDTNRPDDPIAMLRDYVQQVAATQPATTAEDNGLAPESIVRGATDADAIASLRAFVQRLRDSSTPSPNEQVQVAEADNAFDALRQFLQKQKGGEQSPNSSPPPQARPHPPVGDIPQFNATPVGSRACLGCHAVVADTFSHTMMGGLESQGKLQCETCHGPGSVHVQSAGCASCHGDGGVTTRPGFPSLVGQDPQYLVGAMKAYVVGQRQHSMMNALIAGLSDAELNNIAVYYARQPTAQAQTSPVGDPAAGRAATALCANCHGEYGVSVSPAWPSLAGQDAQYIVNALHAYKAGSRNKVIACAGCHGDGGVSSRSGVPSLVGLEPQYLVAAMKAYESGQRKNAVMKALLTGVSDDELNSIANYYAAQKPARAHTPATGDPTAGKVASAACDGCHGAPSVAANPAWPALAGQDAQYIANALHAYKDGSRSDATMKSLASALDDKTISDLAAYQASLTRPQPHPGSGPVAKHDPVLSRNGLVASLDERTILNVAGYYASLHPAQPESAKNAPQRPVPALVSAAAPPDGFSPGGIISYRKDDPGRSVEENNAICLNCHERGERTYWQGSVHETRGLACTECHTIMKSVSAHDQLKTAFQPDTCFQCHKDRRAQMFRASHMPIREGKIVCSDCHNPHGSATEGLIRQVSVNDNCYTCHAEKRGPFLFEHAPVRENCLNCHDPHGSINDSSLKMSTPRLCYECHTIDHGQSGPNAPYTMGRACLNCHTNIHGSNSPAGGVFQR
jgi:DmsE family decaheme c-type cytochrome